MVNSPIDNTEPDSQFLIAGRILRLFDGAVKLQGMYVV